MDVTFLNYLSSLGFQAMIFLGLIPSPVTNKKEENFQQAKLLIDTMVMLREKTKGNLNSQEEKMLDSSIQELQQRYLELS